MKQLLLPDSYNGEQLYSLSKDDSHYLTRVQRRDIGYSLSILSPKGTLYIGTIVDIVNGICTLSLTKENDTDKDNKTEIILFQAIPKGKKIDLMIRQAVETGVSQFYPISAENSIPRFNNNGDKEKKRDRWLKIVKEASQQSGTKKITELQPIQSFKDAIDSINEPFTGLFFHQVPIGNAPLHNSLTKAQKVVVIVIGPEGGLSPKEVELLQNHGFIPSLLGTNILRAETATTFALGAVNMILNEKDNWIIK
ncbi:MAG: hypothetical protein B6229_03600 [Spirochaetaceae bacterium 4572_7]|nr:MAG: hypothetical protein B6229_03600 [Spirochaetaceae bacterium 4572_7]